MTYGALVANFGGIGKFAFGTLNLIFRLTAVSIVGEARLIHLEGFKDA